MNKKSFFLRILGFAVLILVGFILGMGWQERLAERKTIAPETTLSNQEASVPASMMIDTGADILSFFDIKIEPNDTVWSVLERLGKNPNGKLRVESQDYAEMGILITAINGVKGGEDNKYWQYWVNNEYAQVSADKQAVKEGDIIMWKFTNGQFKEY